MTGRPEGPEASGQGPEPREAGSAANGPREPRPFAPREPREFVGRYQPRIDGADKAAGRVEYLDDIALPAKLPGLLHARALRSPYPHARIVRMDTSKAEALPGVHCVLTYADPEVAALKPTTNAWTSMNTAGYDQMYWPSLRDRRVLSDHVTWAGDEAGAVVAAETEALAEQALRLIEVEWQELPFALSTGDALADGAPLIHPKINPANNLFPNAEDTQEDVFHERGDVAAGFAAADVVLEVSSRHHRADHGAMDTRGCLTIWKGDKLTCWTNLYQADQTRIHIADMLDLPLNKVRVMCPYIGGSFGRGNVGDQTFFIFTALLARRTGRPVRYKLSRREDFHDTRNAIDYRIRVGATSDGRITAMETHSIGDSGGYAEHTMAAVKMVLELDAIEVLLAQIPAIRMTGHAVYTNTIPGGCMRGIGNSQLNMALGLMVDALAERLGLDPIDVALRNFSHEWEKPPNRSLTAVLRAGAERVGWEGRHAPGAGPLLNGCKKRGVGFSFNHAWHAGWQELIRGRVQVGIRVNPDLSVILHAPQAETGVGSNTCAVLACAEALGFLGVKPEQIEWINPADTETGLKDMVQTDSSVSYLQAEVMAPAAQEIKSQLREMAAKQLEVAAHEIDIDSGRILVRGEDSGKSVLDVMQAGDMVPLHATATGEMPAEKTGAPYLAAFAEVEVDVETGKVEVVKLAIVHDAGTVMFPSGAEAQQIGGQAQGIGEALYEEIVYDRASGKPLSFDWVDYTMPTMLDMPVVDPVLLEVWRGAGEYGACGIGESAICCTPRAILNAVYNAIGVRINDIPAKPEKILAALARKEQGLPGLDEELHDEIAATLDRALAASAAAQAAESAEAAAGEAAEDVSEAAADVEAARAAADAAGNAAGATAPEGAGAPEAEPAAGRPAPAAAVEETAAGGGRAAYRRAGSFEEAAGLLAAAGGNGRALAGGTDVLGTIKDGVHAEPPALLVDLKTIAGHDRVEERDGALVIGTLTRIADLERDPLVRERAPALAQAAHAVASPQLRAMGTVGGNICQEPRCWYYRAADNAFPCARKGGAQCNAFVGDHRYHSLFGSVKVQARPCTSACPGEVEIPEYMELLRAGDLDGAARRLLARNPIPAVTGRVCPHTCQDGCNRRSYDEAVSIREVERFLGDHILDHPEVLGVPAPATGKRVAIVGSGPAGLAAAYYLRLQGHQVTVLERADEPGGMLRYGIPAYRLPKDVLDGVLARLEGLDVEMCCGVALGEIAGDGHSGESVTLERLRDEYDGVFLATGAWGPVSIGLAGEEELASGLAFLTAVAQGERRVPGPRVLVVGGGSVAFDVAVTARRLGAAKVTVACLETGDEMPALPEEVEEAQAEGIELLTSCGPARLLRDDGRLVGLELVRCTSVFDGSGCFAPAFNEGERWTVEADEVILAVGQRVEGGVLGAAGVELAGGRPVVDPETLQTSVPGVFAGGDVVGGPATVIAAIAAGRRAAEALGEFVGGGARPAGAAAQPAGSAAQPAGGAAQPAEHGDSAEGQNDAALSASDADGPVAGARAVWLQRFDPACLDASAACSVAPRPVGERGVAVEDAATVDAAMAACEARRCFDCGCIAVTPSDLAPVLVALDARIVTTAREIPAAEFFAVGPGVSTDLAADELVREIVLPAPGRPRRCAFRKFRLRNTIDFPIVSAVVVLEVDGETIADARVVLGAVAPVPVRAPAAEAALRGRQLAELASGGSPERSAASGPGDPIPGELARHVAERALEDALPLPGNGYKAQIARALVARALASLS